MHQYITIKKIRLFIARLLFIAPSLLAFSFSPVAADQILCYEKECFILENGKFRKASDIEYKAIYSNADEASKKDQERLVKTMLPNTSWVKDKAPIYYNKRSATTGLSCVYSVNADGSENFKVCDGQAYKICLAPDSKTLLLLIYSKPSYKIYFFDINSKRLTLLKEIMQRTPEEKDFSVEDLAWAPDGVKFIYMLRHFGSSQDYRAQKMVSPVKDSIFLFNLEDLSDKLLLENKWVVPISYYEYLFWDQNSRDIYFANINLDLRKTQITRLDTIAKKEIALGDWYELEDAVSEREALEKTIGKKFSSSRQLFTPDIFENFYTGNISESNSQLFLDCSWGTEGDCNYIYKDARGKQTKMMSFSNIPLPQLFLGALAFPWWLNDSRYALLQFFKKIVMIEPSSGKIGILTEGTYLLPIDYWSRDKWVY